MRASKVRFRTGGQRIIGREQAGSPLLFCPKRTQLFVVAQSLNMKNEPNSKPIWAIAKPIQSHSEPGFDLPTTGSIAC